jgi:predicted RNA methylase
MSEMLLERRWGTETSRVVDLGGLGIESPWRTRYEPSGWWDLRRVLRPGEVASEDVFLDLGSGKGRIVLQAAARYPFRRVVGVELSEDLQGIAAANLAARAETLRCHDVELLVADAAEFAIPDDVTVIYLYNPFRGPIFASALDRIIESLERAPRALRIIYRTPIEEDLLLQTGRFRRIRVARGLRPGRKWSDKMSIRVYESTAPTPP